MNISNIELVETYFGYWPEFSDAKINCLKIHFQTQILTLSLHYIDSDKNKEADIIFAFYGVNKIELNELLEQNILDQLLIENTTDGNFLISIKACYGVVGSLNCNKIEVDII